MSDEGFAGGSSLYDDEPYEGERVSDVVVFVVEHVDVGLTMETRITLNGTTVVTYRPGTKHVAVARETANEVLAHALAPLLAAAARDRDCLNIQER